MALESDSRKLFVAGIADSVTEQGLRAWFEAAGLKVSRVGMPLDRTTGRPRGFAFVTLDSEADAERARQNLDGSRLEGRELSIREFRAESPKRGPGGPRPSSARPMAPRPPMPPRPGQPRPPQRPAAGGWSGGGSSWGGGATGRSVGSGRSVGGTDNASEARSYGPPPSPTRATWDEPRRAAAAPRKKEKKEKRKKGKKLSAERGHLRRGSEAFRWQEGEDYDDSED